jgi:hypothetical protein
MVTPQFMPINQFFLFWLDHIFVGIGHFKQKL